MCPTTLPSTDAGDAKDQKTSSIQVIDRMMHLIDALASYPDPVSLKQLALDTHLHPSTAHRILAALITQGFVERTDNSCYRLGIRLLELGNLVKSRISVREVAMPAMLRLHAFTGESVNLGMRSGDEIVYVERTSSGRSAVRVVHIGGARAAPHDCDGKTFPRRGFNRGYTRLCGPNRATEHDARINQGHRRP